MTQMKIMNKMITLMKIKNGEKGSMIRIFHLQN